LFVLLIHTTNGKLQIKHPDPAHRRISHEIESAMIPKFPRNMSDLPPW
jgi:hypothetical protein